MSGVSVSLTAGLWDDIVRRVGRHDGVLEFQRANVEAEESRISCHTRVDAAAVDTSGVACDGAVRDAERAVVEDGSTENAGYVVDKQTVRDGGLATIEDAAAGHGVHDVGRPRPDSVEDGVLNGECCKIRDGAPSRGVIAGKPARLDCGRTESIDNGATRTESAITFVLDECAVLNAERAITEDAPAAAGYVMGEQAVFDVERALIPDGTHGHERAVVREGSANNGKRALVEDGHKVFGECAVLDGERSLAEQGEAGGITGAIERQAFQNGGAAMIHENEILN